MRDKILRGVVRATLASDTMVRLLGGRRLRATPALDPQIAAVLELQRIARIPALESMEPPRARRFAAEGLSPLDPDPVPMTKLVDITVPGPAGPIPVRLYVPEHVGPHWIVYFHGGGGVIGSIATSEPATRLIASRSRCTVASVEYRLGPEHRHPAAVDDALAAFDALALRVPAGGRVAVAGDSFGGYLSAQVANARRAGGGKRAPDVQGLLYPMVDQTMSSPSIARLADGFLLTRTLIEWFRGNYLAPADDRRAASPLFVDELRGVAPALVVTAGFDPLVDEGVAYADRLAAAGVTVRRRAYPSLIHGFLSLSGAVRAARAAVDELSADLAEMLA